MALSKHPVGSLFGLVQRVWTQTLINPLTLGVAAGLLLMSINAGLLQPDMTVQQASASSPHPEMGITVLPLPEQEQKRLNHQHLIEAAMTGHKLTSAHFFVHRFLNKGSVEVPKTVKHD